MISPSLAGKSPKPVRSLPAAGRLLSIILRGLATLLVLLLAYAAADLTWKLVALTRQAGESPLPPSPALSVPTPKEGAGLSAATATLAGLHLFGHEAKREESHPPPASVEATAHPQTSLQILLVGVFVSSSPQQSLAIIAEKGKKGSETIYGVGDQLPGNALLSEIQTDRVILLRAGRYEALPLDAPPAAKGGTGDKAEAGASAEGAKGAAQASSGTPMTIDRRRWESELSDLPSLANEVGVEPFPAAGKQQGYRLLARGDGRVLNDLGLLAGDIVVEVNGLSLKDPGTALQAYARIKEAETITVRLIRDGRQETKEFTITGAPASQ